MGEFGDISDRVGQVASTQLLADAKALLILPRWAQQRDLPQNRGKTITFRRYSNLAVSINPILGSNTPTGTQLSNTDLQATIEQFGSWVPVSQEIRDTHEDPILQESQRLSSYQLAQTIDVLTFNVVKGGTNVTFAGGVASRALVNSIVQKKHFRAAVRNLENANAMPFTSIVDTGPEYATSALEASYFGYVHPDMAPTLRAIEGFNIASEYAASADRLPGELGKIENIRFIRSTIASPFAGAGATGGIDVIETGGNADVYPILIFATDAFATTQLAGMDATRLMVHNPTVTDTDPLKQRGSVGWIAWYTSVILNQSFLHRIESAAPADEGISNL